MIIIGVNDRAKTIGHGTFFCPHCQATRPYQRKKAKLYFSVFFIPLIPLKELGEYVACDHCRERYALQVLERQPKKAPAAVEQRTPPVRLDLESGTPLEMARQKLINQGYAPSFAEELVEAATGSSLKKCPTCRLTYLPVVERCAACGGILEKSV